MNTKTCEICQGTGRDKPECTCPICNGSGVVVSAETVKVKPVEVVEEQVEVKEEVKKGKKK